jgi:hypothetical protein
VDPLLQAAIGWTTAGLRGLGRELVYLYDFGDDGPTPVEVLVGPRHADEAAAHVRHAPQPTHPANPNQAEPVTRPS